jgi:hypothetical protein
MSIRAAAALLALLLLTGCGAEPQAAAPRERPPVYSAADIGRFDFQGVRLGMTREEVCPRILAAGYRNRDGFPCGPAAPMHEGEEAPIDVFLGGAYRDCTRNACRPSDPAAGVTFLTLVYERVGGRDVVRTISADTAEPGPVPPKTAATISEWGVPTFIERGGEGGYDVLIYGESRAQADWSARETYSRCTTFPDCAAERGTDCGAVLSDFATATAEVTVYHWGRLIRIEDRTAELRALRASGRLQGRRRVPEPFGCPHPAPAH